MGQKALELDGKELRRLEVLSEVAAGALLQREAALELGISERQVRTWMKRFRERGAAGLASGHRGRSAANRIPDAVREAALAQVREQYAGFSAAHAHEHLRQEPGMDFSLPVLRHWMQEAGLCPKRRRPRAAVHQQRPRRARLGELVQADGSPHAWFGDRGPRSSLLLFIDDATSRLMAMRLAPAETLHAYLGLFREYVREHGLPCALYTDKYSVFRTSRRDADPGPTQFERMLESLDVQMIHAHSPQAKGRVERSFRTHQQRLTAEFRRLGIRDLDAANAHLPRYMAEHNARFAVAAQDDRDAHRACRRSEPELERIFSVHSVRTLSRNLEFRYDGRVYQIRHRWRRRLGGRKVTVCEGLDGTVRALLLATGRELEVKALGASRAAPIADGKELNGIVDRAVAARARRPYVPPPEHPWKRASYEAMRARQEAAREACR